MLFIFETYDITGKLPVKLKRQIPNKSRKTSHDVKFGTNLDKDNSFFRFFFSMIVMIMIRHDPAVIFFLGQFKILIS